MEMPFHLKTIPAASLEILRYFGANSITSTHYNDLMRGAGLSEAALQKGLEGLVTERYLEDDDNQTYTLTERGQNSISELASYDAATSDDGASDRSASDESVAEASATSDAGQVVELPFHLRTLPPEALTVMRHMATLPEPNIHYDDLFDQLDLGERTFGKVIRRLVTKGYANMVADQVYALSDRGTLAVQELARYDAAIRQGGVDVGDTSIVADTVTRRLVLVLPSRLVAGQSAKARIGFNAADADNTLPEETDVVVRASVLNGEPSSAKDHALTLQNDAAHFALDILPGQYTQIRLRVEVFQLWPNPEDITPIGGMYVDADVHADGEPGASQVAYGIDIDLNV